MIRGFEAPLARIIRVFLADQRILISLFIPVVLVGVASASSLIPETPTSPRATGNVFTNSRAQQIAPTMRDTPGKVSVPLSPLPAFPGAEGWGAQSQGGRGGTVIEVTNLEDSGFGSLRACVQGSGPRICVFRVAGTIALNSRLRITKPFLTIAGQTAPGDGITIQNFGFLISTNNVIMRYLRWRGPAFQFIAIRATHDTHDIIVDHCSASWHADAGVGSGTTIGIWYNDEQRTDPLTSEI